eukprot:14019616-Alexandrium_andersonii.AAC.1
MQADPSAPRCDMSRPTPCPASRGSSRMPGLLHTSTPIRPLGRRSLASGLPVATNRTNPPAD